MRTPWMALLLLSIASCAITGDIVQASHGWDGRDVADLITVIGPEDSVIINKELKSFNWFRFGNCRLTAFTATDNKIIRVETTGTVDGCSAYVEKMQRK